MSERHSPEDTLRARYAEASAREDAMPGAHVRDAVLARAREVAARAGQAPAARKPANDAVWGMRAVASIAVIGLAGLIAKHYLESPPDFDAKMPSVASGSSAQHAAAPQPIPAEVDALKQKAAVADAAAGGASTDSAAPEMQASKRVVAEPATPAAIKKPRATPPSANVKAGTETDRDRLLADKTVVPADAAAVMRKPAEAQDRVSELAKAAPAPLPAPEPQMAATIPPQAPPASAPKLVSPAPAPAPASASPAEPPMPRAKVAEGLSASAPLAESRASAASATGGTGRSQAERAEFSGAPMARATSADKASRPTDSAALIAAARAGNVTAISAALTAGVAPNTRDADGTPVLILAAQAGCEICVLFLAEKGADINARDRQEMSALMHARRLGKTAVVDMLNQLGARQ